MKVSTRLTQNQNQLYRQIKVAIFLATQGVISACGTDSTSSGTTGTISVTQNTLLAVHACLATECSQGPSKHSTYLLESPDGGESWSLVSGWEPYRGSVPDLIRRDGKIYIFNPQEVRVLNIEEKTLSSSSTVSITDSSGAAVQFVDPSPILRSDGRIVLHYLISTGSMGVDPAGCTSYPCTKTFGSAVEVEGSAGTQFVADVGTRVTATISASSDPLGPVASDPDIFAAGGNFVLYLSRGNSVQIFEGTSLSGAFTDPAGGSVSLSNTGGVPAGHFDGTNYWAITNKGSDSNPMAKVIRRAKSTTLSGLATASFTDWVTATHLGLSNDYSVESPGFLSATE